ncbi:unnamed protein product [Adineta steineri]|uniref:EGF-like domain-containing protein n=1 Tax=Adineta steineri TaxID=433720 RepID=A0A814RK77_9BILA|nr:unnamed protein product [Adineta steineri]CAF1184313.1 unnamed protein product [Adineta steineri]
MNTCLNGKRWSFSELLSNEISPWDVLSWSSGIEKADDYARVFYNRSENFEDDPFLCQCLEGFLGKKCEYQLLFDPSSFNKAWPILFKAHRNSEGHQLYGSILCYETLKCDSGMLCLDWRDVCNGQQNCMDGLDEENCDLLEFNECENDEYRCTDGMCIAEEYWLDASLDCMDWTDEAFDLHGDTCVSYPWPIYCDDHTCPIASCWNDSFTFSGRPYAFYDICPNSSICFSQYRIADGLTDCALGEDEDSRAVEKRNYCHNIQKHRLQCSPEQMTCLSLANLVQFRNVRGTCVNKYDIKIKGEGQYLYSIRCADTIGLSDCNLLRYYIGNSSIPNSNFTNTDAESSSEQRSPGVTPFHYYCDTFWDEQPLPDDENKTNCQSWICPEEFFRCNTGQCILTDWVCDGEWDCSDASDEFGLPKQWINHNEHLSTQLNDRKKLCKANYAALPFRDFCNFSREYPCYRSTVSHPLDVNKYPPCINHVQIGDGIEDCYGCIDEKNTFKDCNGNMLGYTLKCGNKCAGSLQKCDKNTVCSTSVLCSYKNHHIFHVNPLLEINKPIKHRFYLLYSRSDTYLNHKKSRYFNRTDILHDHPYEVYFNIFVLTENATKQIGSFLHPIYFDFLPAFRLATVLKYPSWISNSTFNPCIPNPCNANAYCNPILNKMRYYICSCKSGYSGSKCENYHTECSIYCSSDSICRPNYRGVIASTQHPLCICPFGYFGPRCHLRNDACLSNPCGLNATCYPSYDPSGENNVICVCSKRFYGDRCQNEKLMIHIQVNMSALITVSVTQFYDHFKLFNTLSLSHQQVTHGLPQIIRYDNDREKFPLMALLKIYQEMLSPRYFIVYAQWLTGPINITSTPVECPHVLDIFSQVCITAVIQSKSEQQHHHRRQLFGSSTSRIPTSGYRVDSYKVYFNGQLVEGLSASSFKDLGYGYGKDIMHVFFMGKQIKGASGSSFQVLAGGWYSKDFMDVYYWGEKLPGASGSSFQVLSGQYAKDFMDVFYAGKKIQGASASSFKVLGNGYAKDSWDTYYMGEKVHNG